jgi:hypothetical protein
MGERIQIKKMKSRKRHIAIYEGWGVIAVKRGRAVNRMKKVVMGGHWAYDSLWNLPVELEDHVQEQINAATKQYHPTAIATPGEGAVIVEGVSSKLEHTDPPKDCKKCRSFEDGEACIFCAGYDLWKPMMEPLTLPDNSTDMLMDALRKSEIN